MANICVIGSLEMPREDLVEDVRMFVTCLGEEIVRRDHNLYTGCMNDLDELIARSASTWLKESGSDLEPSDRIFNYVIESGKPVQKKYGKILASEQKNWTEAQSRVLVPEQISKADVVVLVGGGTGTRMGADWADIIDKLLLPVTSFGGTAAKVYKEEYKIYNTKYRKDLKKKYENLNQIEPDWNRLASDVIDLAEQLTSSRDVCVIRSISEDPMLIDIIDSFEYVCCQMNAYEKCEPISEITAEKGILEEIKERIEKAAFIIADLTEEKPNVYYELGYAEGLGKRIIATAKKGTILHFDVQGNSTLFWEGQTDLKKQLKEKIEKMGLSRPAKK